MRTASNLLESKKKRYAAWRAHYRSNPTGAQANPYVGSHPDLFGKTVMEQYPRRPGPVATGKGGVELEYRLHGPPAGSAAARARLHATGELHAKRGDTPVFVPLSELTNEQVRELKRGQFTDEEWDEIDEDDQEYILENDTESQARVDALARPFISRWEWEKDDSRDRFPDVEHIFEDLLASSADTLYKSIPTRRYQALVRDADERLGLDETDVDQILNDILSNTNLYYFDTNTHRANHDVFEQMDVHGSFYIERGDWEYELLACTPDEVRRAIEKVVEDTEHDIDLERILDRRRKTLYDAFDIETDFETGVTVYAMVNWGSVDDDARDRLTELAAEREVDRPDNDDTGVTVVAPEERVVYRWKDGFYAQILLPSELADEGKAMGMCVGRPDMGYGAAVRRGEIRIISIRRPSGKPLFTIEAENSPSSESRIADGPFAGEPQILRIEQVKGKANRLPGWDLGKVGPPNKMKQDEVERVYDLIEGAEGLRKLGLEEAVDDIRDCKPAAKEVNRLYRDGDPWAIKLLSRLGIEAGPPLTHSLDRPQPNPGGSACGLHGEQCTGFCLPYRRRR